jgi:hypothetical protein
MHSYAKNQVNISNHSEKKVVITKIFGQISKPNGCKLAKNHSTGMNLKNNL